MSIAKREALSFQLGVLGRRAKLYENLAGDTEQLPKEVMPAHLIDLVQKYSQVGNANWILEGIKRL